ncbi:MAG: hypothetical protein BroJett018_27340 [Chloroflexota bacterium]|nr:MAG: hypothetical protein BroJett018_27340 [Chloroflexota bacterium]
MLTKLRFKNWRSLRDVTIEDLTPLTVFIGANSSGKTNIVDGLHFLRDSNQYGVFKAVSGRNGMEKVRSFSAMDIEPLEIEFSFTPSYSLPPLCYEVGIKYENNLLPKVAEILKSTAGEIFVEATYDEDEGVQIRHNIGEDIHPLPDAPFGWEQTVLSVFGDVPTYGPIYHTYQFMMRRWQILDEMFDPQLSLPIGQGDFGLLDNKARNLPSLLHFMQAVEKSAYEHMMEDLSTLTSHVEGVEISANEYETRILIKEALHQLKEAPTISAGTRRIVAMLAAYYSLDIGPRAKMPGLLVIEEPDTALNPGILRVFVDLLRRYVSREGYPRQIILTTHNPYFLDFFEPDEVRVVERDREGYSHVNRIDPAVWDIWKDQYTLGQVWLANSFGGLPL